MKNYIDLNGKKIKLTDEQIAEMTKSLGISQIRLADVPKGETFKIGKYEFIVLEQSNDTTAVILKNLLFENKTFGKNNNYENSYVDDLCNDFAGELEEIIGAKNLISHTVDLTSDDGLKNYGSIRRKVSLLTTDLYRRYVEILDKHKLSKYWWLATAYSTPTHSNATWVKCVAPSGGIGNLYIYNYFNVGVRPFCIFDANIFVSK